MLDTNSTGFIITDYNLEQNSITVRPFSPLFKKPIETYECFNITITNLDPLRNIEEQLACLTKPIVDNILKQEQQEFKKEFEDFLQKYKNVPVTVSNNAIKNSHIETKESLEETGVLEIIT